MKSMLLRSSLVALGLSLSLVQAGCGSAEANADAGPQSQPPGAPTGFSVMEMGTGAHAMWNDTFSDETGFELARKDGAAEWTIVMTLAANVDNYHDGSITPGVTYTYRVRALSAVGPGAWSAEATIELPLLAPGAPSNASAMKMGGGVHFMWRDGTSDETRFEIERHAAAGAFSNVHNTAANATYWMDMAVTAGETYSYRVRAATPAGLTDWSNEVTISL